MGKPPKVESQEQRVTDGKEKGRQGVRCHRNRERGEIERWSQSKIRTSSKMYDMCADKRRYTQCA